MSEPANQEVQKAPASSELALPPPKPPAADANGQLIVSLTIVLVLGCLGGGMIWVGDQIHDFDKIGVGLGAIVGILGTALNAPTGISNVIRAGLGQKPQ